MALHLLYHGSQNEFSKFFIGTKTRESRITWTAFMSGKKLFTKVTMQCVLFITP